MRQIMYILQEKEALHSKVAFSLTDFTNESFLCPDRAQRKKEKKINISGIDTYLGKQDECLLK